MSQSSTPPKPTLDNNFWTKWILANCLGYGVGLGLPILLSDLISSLVQSYKGNFWVGAIMLTFGTVVGLLQWLVLRSIMPIPKRWIWVASSSPLFALCLTGAILQRSQPPIISLSVFAIGVYPLVLSLRQWRIFRQIFCPSWGWIIANSTSVSLSGLVCGILIAIFRPSEASQLGVIFAIGGLGCGLIYSLISGLGLEHLMRQKYILNTQKQPVNLDVPPNSNPFIPRIVSLLSLLATFGVWYVVLPAPSFKSLTPIDSFSYWLMFIVYIRFSILVHELGHVVFAIANGFDIKHLAVGRWVLIRREKSMKWLRTRHRYTNGFVEVIPRNTDSLNRKLFMTILGGPLASFLLFCVSTIPLLFQGLVSKNIIIWLITFFSIYNLYMAIYNCLPIRVGYVKTDGCRMLDLAQNNLQGQRFAAFYRFDASLRQGIRPRDIDALTIERMLAISEKSFDRVAGLLNAYYVELDKGKFDQAGRYLDSALDLHLFYPALFRGFLFLEGVYFEAHIRRRTDVARQWFEKIQDKAFIQPYSLLRAEAALLFAEGDREGALSLVDRGIISSESGRLMLGSAIAESDWLQALREDILHFGIDDRV